MSIKEGYKYGSTYSNLISSFQSDSQKIADSTQELMKATAIISSKTGRTFEDTAERIRSAGIYRGYRRLRSIHTSIYVRKHRSF